MQRVLTCLLFALIVCGTVASAQNGRDARKDQGHAKDDSSSALEMRVVGGKTISNAELGGYIVAMYYFNTFACGGTLISETIVISAAHCFVNREIKSAWDIIGGISSLNEPGVRRKVKEYTVSMYYDNTHLNSDLAVVLLNEPMVGNNISAVSLCTTVLKPGMPLVVSGWGLTKEGTKQDVYLRTATVPFIDMNVCRQNYKNTDVILTNSMICAGVLGKKDACLYDSGGPLVYNKEICGIVSFGIGCAHTKYPGVYTDITFVKHIIEKSIQDFLKV